MNEDIAVVVTDVVAVVVVVVVVAVVVVVVVVVVAASFCVIVKYGRPEMCGCVLTLVSVYLIYPQQY